MMNTNKRTRGFLLIEAVVASGLVSIALMAIFQQLVVVDRHITTNIRKTQALALMEQRLNSFRIMNYSAIPTVAAPGGMYSTENSFPDIPRNTVRRRTFLTLSPAGSTCNRCKIVRVEVTYNINRRRDTVSAQVVIPQ